MKKTRIFAVLAAMAMGLAVFGCSNGDSDSSESGSTGGSTSGSIEPVAENFVKIPAISIAGTEKWTPESEVFVSGRKLEIGSFYMSDHEVTRGEYKAVMGSDPSTANAYGLYDMSGNVLEWCWDWYSAVFSDTPAAGPASGSYRCQRGGSWSRSDYYARVAYRSDRYPYNRNDYYGFRLVRNAN